MKNFFGGRKEGVGCAAKTLNPNTLNRFSLGHDILRERKAPKRTRTERARVAWEREKNRKNTRQKHE
jgi:hypothetical protein